MRKRIGGDFQEKIESGGLFQHRVFFKPGRGDTLHIYIDGDGKIWQSPTQISPRPRMDNSIALDLMRGDSAPALLIGRPCYLEVDDNHCTAKWWTSARYATEVVDSLVNVAERWGKDYRQIYLIGYSGGGALVTLMAPKLKNTATVITLAGNLDTDAWSAAHRYTHDVVGESLNPIKQAPLAANIAQWHFIGSRDTNVDWQSVERYADLQKNARFELIDGVDHRGCGKEAHAKENNCWQSLWPELLAKVIAENNF